MTFSSSHFRFKGKFFDLLVLFPFSLAILEAAISDIQKVAFRPSSFV
jgi:hypothetical protein